MKSRKLVTDMRVIGSASGCGRGTCSPALVESTGIGPAEGCSAVSSAIGRKNCRARGAISDASWFTFRSLLEGG